MELDRIAEETIRKCGAIHPLRAIRRLFKNVPDFPGSICASVNDEVVHGYRV